MDAVRIVNWIEVVLWCVIGCVFLWRAVTRCGRGRWEAALLAVVFLAFGVSDYVELQTGAWWRPWWLAAWKVGCGVVFVQAFLIYRKRKSAKSATGKR